jgi:hypothetical protein
MAQVSVQQPDPGAISKDTPSSDLMAVRLIDAMSRVERAKQELKASVADLRRVVREISEGA